MKWSAIIGGILGFLTLATCSAVPDLSAFAERRAASEQRALAARGYSDFLRARYASLTNDPHQAAHFYARAVRSNPDDQDLLERAVFTALIAGDVTAAQDTAREAKAATLARTSLPRLVLGVEALKAQKYERATRQLLPETASLFNDTIARSLIAWATVETQGTDQALALLETTNSGDSLLDGLSLSTRAFIQIHAGQDGDALQTLEEMWQGNIRLAVSTEYYARLLAADGQRDKAARVLRQFVNRIGPNAAIKQLRADLKNDQEMPVSRPTIDEGAALAIYTPAAALAAQTRNDLSGVYFALALDLDPGLDIARTLWGDALDNANRREDAIALLNAVPETSVFYATSRGQIAWAQRREDQNEAALKTARTALDAAPDRDLKIQLGDLFRSLDRPADAERIFTEIIDEDTKRGEDDWRIYYARGTVREQLNRWQGAKEDLMRANNIAPNQPALLNYLGYAWVDRGENLEEGFEMIQRAAALRPNSGAIIDSLGWAYFKRGDYAEAVTYLERAVSLTPSEPVINGHLGDAYWRAGREKEAGFQWNRTIRLSPDSDDVPLLKSKIENGL